MKSFSYMALLMTVGLAAQGLLAQDEQETEKDPTAKAQENLKEKIAKKTENSAADDLFDDIVLASRDNDLATVFTKFDEMLKEYLFDRNVISRMMEYLEKNGEEFREAWGNHYSVEIDKFLRGETIDLTILLKSRYSNRSSQVCDRLLSLLTESGRVIDIVRVIDMAEHLKLDLDQKRWAERFSKLASSLRKPAIKFWLLNGPYSKYLGESRKIEMSNSILQGQELKTFPVGLAGYRPAPRYEWTGPLSMVKAGEGVFFNKSRAYKSLMHCPYNQRVVPQLSHRTIKYVTGVSDSQSTLWAFDEVTGKMKWMENFGHRRGMALTSYNCIDSMFDQLDVLGWMSPTISQGNRRGNDNLINYGTDILMRDSAGQMMWRSSFKKLLGEHEKMFLAGTPMRHEGRIYLPAYSILAGGQIHLALSLICLDAQTGELIWNHDLEPFIKEKDRFRRQMYDESHVQLLMDSGILWLDTGANVLLALESKSGQLLFRKNVRSGVKVSTQFRSSKQLELEEFERGFFVSVSGKLVCQTKLGKRCNIYESHSVKLLTSFETTGCLFLGEVDKGLLFYEKAGFILVSGLGTKQVVFDRYPVERVAKMKTIIPWTQGCLISDGRDLFQVAFSSAKKSKIQPKYLMTLDRRYRTSADNITRFVLRGKNLYAYNNSFCDRIFMWPDDPEKLRKIWLAEKNDFDLFQLLLQKSLDRNDWDGFKELLDSSKETVYSHQELLAKVVGQGLQFQLNAQLDRAKWIYQFVVEAGEQGGAITAYVDSCLKGQEPTVASAVFKLDPDYSVGAEALKISLWQFGKFETKIPAHFKDIEQFKPLADRMQEDQPFRIFSKKQNLKKESLLAPLSENVMLCSDKKSIYYIEQNRYTSLPAPAVAWSWNRVFYIKSSTLVAARLKEGKFVTEWSYALNVEELNAMTMKPTKSKKHKNSRGFAEEIAIINGQAVLVNHQQDTQASSSLTFFVQEPFLLVQSGSSLICFDSEKGHLLWERHFNRVLYGDSFRFEGKSVYLAAELEERQVNTKNNIYNLIRTSARGTASEKILTRIDRVMKIDLMTGSLVWKQNVDAPRVNSYKVDGGIDGRDVPKVQMTLSDEWLYVFAKDKWHIIDKKTGVVETMTSKTTLYSDFKFVQNGKYFLFEKGRGLPALLTKRRKSRISGKVSCGRRVTLVSLPDDSRSERMYATVGDIMYVFLAQLKNQNLIQGYNVNTGLMLIGPDVMEIPGQHDKHKFGEAKVMGTDVYFSIYEERASERGRRPLRVPEFALYRYNTVTKKVEKLITAARSFSVHGNFVSVKTRTSHYAYFYKKKEVKKTLPQSEEAKKGKVEDTKKKPKTAAEKQKDVKPKQSQEK